MVLHPSESIVWECNIFSYIKKVIYIVAYLKTTQYSRYRNLTLYIIENSCTIVSFDNLNFKGTDIILPEGNTCIRC